MADFCPELKKILKEMVLCGVCGIKSPDRELTLSNVQFPTIIHRASLSFKLQTGRNGQFNAVQCVSSSLSHVDAQFHHS
jgi:hypothetical protein